MTAIKTSTASAERIVTRPKVGVLGIMQELYDEMLPGITERQGVCAQEVGRALGDSLEVHVAPPARDRTGIEAALRRPRRPPHDGAA
jgi:L-arabinose isomerase